MSQDLVEDISGFFDDMGGFVRYNFPWGVADGPLAQFDGPDEWQIRVMDDISRHVKAGEEGAAFRLAIASGHGIGKSAFVSWLILWFISTRPKPQIVVTANTQGQLKTKTWRELAKWHKMSLNSDWFVHTATKFYLKEDPETWFAAAIPWSEQNSEAFAGTHEEHVMVIFDEASAIPDVIWTVCEGAMTTPGAMWFAFGNPTRNTGRFHDCFSKFGHRWVNRGIDSREAKMTNKVQLQEWIDDYGEDSDFVRVRVRGVFPRAGSAQFIPGDVIEFARDTNLEEEAYKEDPHVLSVDVARFGDDDSVIVHRQGRKVHALWKYHGVDTMSLASKAAIHINDIQPDAVFVDGAGVGGGVIDRLKQLGYNPIEVQFAGRPNDAGKYKNKRMECWALMKDALTNGLDIPKDPDLLDQLGSVEFFYAANNTLQLEKKEDMKKRGVASPDIADALAISYAEPVRSRKGRRWKRKRPNWRSA